MIGKWKMEIRKGKGESTAEVDSRQLKVESEAT
jgi:hypothetical protein